jgi:hypothetical protein
MLNAPQLLREVECRRFPFQRAILDTYFNLLTEEMRISFERDFTVAQEVLVAAGAPFIDLADLWAILGSHFISIYYCKGDTPAWGYFCPLGVGAKMEWGHADERFPQAAEMLKTRFGFEEFGGAKIFKSLRTFSSFITRARVHETHGRQDEAFLHYVLALDLLLGTRDENTHTVCKRTAALLAAHRRQPFPDTLKLMKSLYDARSRYVHGGEPVTGQDMDHLKPVLDVVFESLMRLQGHPESQADGFMTSWCKELDFVASAFETGRALSASDLARLGLE